MPIHILSVPPPISLTADLHSPNGQVEGWVLSSKMRPLRLLVIVNRSNRALQMPSPHKFCKELNDNYTNLDMPVKDYDYHENMRVTRVNSGVGMLCADGSFHRLIGQVVIRRNRQTAGLESLTALFCVRFLDGIILSGPLRDVDYIYTGVDRAPLRPATSGCPGRVVGGLGGGGGPGEDGEHTGCDGKGGNGYASPPDRDV